MVLTIGLWLTGCATQNSDLTADTADATATTQTGSKQKSKQYTPLYPDGSLQPILAGQANSRDVAALHPPANMWERIRRGFAMPDLQSDLVQDREKWYATRPDYVERMTERGRKYLFYIVEELERRNMPTELALLPFIESAFNPQAVSSAKAAGMWQFMPATGKTFELKQNMFRDDRRDVIESTRAALDYMQKLYGMFGDWHLALAAYNWGEGSVKRAIDKATKAGTSTAYADLAMPMETRFYVPKLQAIKNIVSTPEAFNSKLPLIENHPYFQSVDLKRDLDVAIAAKLAEISVDDFRALNPSANRPVLLAAGTPQILLPWDNAATFQSNLEAFTGARLASWTAWITPTAMKPADAAKRVGMPEIELRAINQIPERMIIKAGSTLLVRRSVGFDTDVSVHIAENGWLSLSPDVVLKKTIVKAGKKETMASLAQRYKVSPQNLAEWNKLSLNATLKPGQPLAVFLPVKAPTAPQASKAAQHTSARVAVKPKPVTGKATRLARK
jgi:membrane-bound lytic murein transglycosylase D